MAGQRKSATDRKAEIVGAAIRLAGDLGPDRVSAQMLADAVGVSQPAIFRHFASKSEIWLAVGQRITDAVGRENLQAEPGQARAMLQDVVGRNFDSIQSNPAIPSILFSRELHEQNDALRRRFDEVMRHRRAGFARLIAQAQGEGGMPGDAPPEDVAALLLAGIQGLAMRWSLEGRGFDLRAEGDRLLAVLLGPDARG